VIVAAARSQSQQIARAIAWLKGDFTQSLRIDDLAAQASMSTSPFHHHFRAMTALSPLQYQKQLRLQEARRLMLTERIDAATAAIQVGYESPSQFSGEYDRLFGSPSLRDVHNLRNTAAGGRGQRLRQGVVNWQRRFLFGVSDRRFSETARRLTENATDTERSVSSAIAPALPYYAPSLALIGAPAARQSPHPTRLQISHFYLLYSIAYFPVN